jgi:transposase
MVDYISLVSYKNKDKKIANKILDTNFNSIDTVLRRIQTNGESLPAKNWRTEKPTFIKVQKKSIKEIIEGDINIELNKLSPKNYTDITNKILKNFIFKYEDTKREEILSSTLDNLFTKAVSQPIYCPYYVLFLKIFIEQGIEVETVITQKCDKFKNILIEHQDVSASNRVETVTDENYDDFCKNLKQKNFKLGYSQFVGELYNNKLISVVILLESLDIMFCNIQDKIQNGADMKSEFIEDNIICLCKMIETLKEKFVVETYIEKLQSIQKQKGLPKRLSFSIMDTLESIT